jgi:tripartite-type tricarboxylate transporter receptor subunit TctC
VTVDNVPSAGGSIGADKVAKSPADGYTLLMGHIGTLAVNPLIFPKLAYNPVKDFAPEAYGRHIAKEIERWRPVVKAGNIQPS